MRDGAEVASRHSAFQRRTELSSARQKVATQGVHSPTTISSPHSELPCLQRSPSANQAPGCSRRRHGSQAVRASTWPSPQAAARTQRPPKTDAGTRRGSQTEAGCMKQPVMQGPSPKSQSDPSTSTHREYVAPAAICTIRSKPLIRVGTMAEAVVSRGPRPRAESWRQPKLQTRPSRVRTRTWPSPTAMSTAESPGGKTEVGSTGTVSTVPVGTRPEWRQTKTRPSRESATLKQKPRATFFRGGKRGPFCRASAASASRSGSLDSRAVKPPVQRVCPSCSRSTVTELVAERPTTSTGSAPAAPSVSDGIAGCSSAIPGIGADGTRPSRSRRGRSLEVTSLPCVARQAVQASSPARASSGGGTAGATSRPQT
mmetsp:Transcript_95632/g.298794  ORF Transcript_95632/g.298794 Transcript_95632/m.298794 type:complete len:371 (-) Transcript_95632:1822-2934(-)